VKRVRTATVLVASALIGQALVMLYPMEGRQRANMVVIWLTGLGLVEFIVGAILAGRDEEGVGGLGCLMFVIAALVWLVLVMSMAMFLV
jgi:hypothetical protein